MFTYFAAVMVVSFTAGGTTSAFAKESPIKDSNEESITGANSILTVDKLSGTSASSVESLFQENQRMNQNQEGSPRFSNLTLTYKGGKLVLRGNLMYANKAIDFESSGNIFKNEKTNNSRTCANLILGEMSDFDNFHFVQLKIDKDQSSIMIILQTKNTKQLIKFQISIDKSVFNQLYNSYKNQLSGTALEKKIIQLYSVTGNLVDKNTSARKESSISPSVSTSNIHTMATSYSGWSKLIGDLNANGSVNLSNYSNIDPSFLTTNGWHGEAQWGNTPYTFVSYSGQNGPNDYLTQFALVDVVTQSYDTGTNGQWYTGIQATYNNGMIADYNISSNTLKVVYYGWGLRLNNFKIGVGPLTNKAIFINRTVNSLAESGGNWVRAAIAVIDPFTTVSTIFDYLGYFENQDKNSTKLFESNISDSI